MTGPDMAAELLAAGHRLADALADVARAVTAAAPEVAGTAAAENLTRCLACVELELTELANVAERGTDVPLAARAALDQLTASAVHVTDAAERCVRALRDAR